MRKVLKPFIAIGPGEHIREEIEERGWSVEEFADRLCMSSKHVSEILNDKKPVTIETARALSQVFGTSAQFWMNLYTNYIFSKAEDKEDGSEVLLKAKIYEIMPVSDMVKKGWIEKPDTIEKLMACVKKVWGTDIIDDVLSEIALRPLAAFRKSKKESFSHNYTQTWLRFAKKISAFYRVPAYDPEAFKLLCDKAHEYSLRKDGVEIFIREINKTGVKFFVLPHLTKTYVDGAAFMDKKTPVIVYTGRYDKLDNFWFTVMHEAGHVINHLSTKDESFVDDLSAQLNGEKEKEVDAYSREKLKIPDILCKFKADTPSRVSWISTVSSQFQISPAIIVGALQHANLLTYRSKMLSAIKESVLSKIPDLFSPDVKRLCN